MDQTARDQTANNGIPESGADTGSAELSRSSNLPKSQHTYSQWSYIADNDGETQRRDASSMDYRPHVIKQTRASGYVTDVGVNKDGLRLMKLREEIARSRQTVDNDPIQYDDNENVKVDVYANDQGTWSVEVTCTTDPTLSFPLQRFPDEGSAKHYARQCSDRIIRKTMNEVRRLVRLIIMESLENE